MRADPRSLVGALLLVVLCARCAGPSSAAAPVVPEAGFVVVPARDVTVRGEGVHISATGRLFYNLRPADSSPGDKPIVFLFNGFAAEVVRAFGTGPTTVAPGGAVIANPSSLTSFANLVYLEPRQAGYSYDVVEGRAEAPSDFAPGIFNEYVDAADVLLGALAFLDAHPELTGPVYWFGESYAGVRITWILAYLRGHWDLAPYADPALAAKLADTHRPTSLFAGQIFLEAWLAGGAETATIAAECTDAAVVAGVSASLGTPCAGGNACVCASAGGRSPYNYTYTVAAQTERETEASLAHTLPDRAAALMGVPLTSIPELAAEERGKGFKCSAPDDTVPPQDALVGTLGALPTGQAYYVPYSPLLPGKETSPVTLDWRTENLEALAFADDLRDVPAFLTAGQRDMVVPTSALAPALRVALGADRVDETSATRLGVNYPDGARNIDVFAYPNAGHMITMVEPGDFARDLAGWIGMRGP